MPGVVASITGAVVATAWAAGAAGATVGGAVGLGSSRSPQAASTSGTKRPRSTSRVRRWAACPRCIRPLCSVELEVTPPAGPRLPIPPQLLGIPLECGHPTGRLKHPQRRYLVGRTVDAQYLNPATLPPEKDVGRSARPWQNGSVDQHRAARWWLRGGRDGRIPALKPEVRGSAILTPYLPTRNLRGSYAPEEEKTETGHGCRGRESSRSPFPHARRVPGERPRVLGLVRTR